MVSFLYHADAERGRTWADVFRRERPDIEFRIWPDVGDALDVRYLATWVPPPDLAMRFPNLEVLFSTGAGVDQFDLSVLPSALPLVRMQEPGIERSMVEYVTHAVLELHRDMPAYRRQQQARNWQSLPVKRAHETRVGVLGLGRLGRAVLAPLAAMGFDCAGWSRSPQAVDGVSCFAGADALGNMLARTDVLVCLLPLTEQTRGLLDAALFARLPAGASLVHVGRGAQLVSADLLAALDRGQLAEALLDVTDPEPLPQDHPLWMHPRVRITPHIASMTQPESAARVVIDNLRRHAAGLPLIGLVDRQRGY